MHSGDPSGKCIDALEKKVNIKVMCEVWDGNSRTYFRRGKYMTVWNIRTCKLWSWEVVYAVEVTGWIATDILILCATTGIHDWHEWNLTTAAVYHKEQNYKLFWFNDKLWSKIQKSKQPEAGAGKSKEKLKRLKTNQKPGFVWGKHRLTVKVIVR